MLALILTTLAVFALVLGAVAAWGDVRGMRIANWISLAVLLSFVAAFGLSFLPGAPELYFHSWLSHLVAGGAIFAITYGLYLLKMFGAGDSKLLSAYAFWVGVKGLLPLLFYMALAGGILGAMALLLKKAPLLAGKELPSGSWLSRLRAGENVVPYGVAIVIGAAAAFCKLGYLSGG